MSYTTIYRLGRDPCEIGETRNSWRSAMYVWNDVAIRYCGLENFPWDRADQNRVWNANSDPRMPEHERIVLLSTMDNAVVFGRDRDAIVAAFRKYAAEHPNCSLGEQADLIMSVELESDDMIAWNQTSVGEFWGKVWNEERQDSDWYDPALGKHFDVYAEAVKERATPKRRP